ncbi:MAG: hypothetical protein J2P48_24710, partial [Alphaproteobacteria bacterium]|nr:hypothetical protein [Alphaproteobacteria bacterium]
MFGITGPPDEHRREPVLGRGIARPGQELLTNLVPGRPSGVPSAGRPQSGRAKRAAADGFRKALNAVKIIPPARRRGVSRTPHERDAALCWEDPGDAPRSRGVFGRPREVEEGWWERLRGPLGSVLVHLLPLLLLIDWRMAPSGETEPVPVQLVLEPPPAPPRAKPAPPQPKLVSPPPRGPLASDDLGEPEAKDMDRAKRDAPARADSSPKSDTPTLEAKPVEKPPQTAAVEPWPLPGANPDAPTAEPVPKPVP